MAGSIKKIIKKENPLITILTVNYNTNDMIKILLSTVKETPVIVVENSIYPVIIKGSHKTIINSEERTHGYGLNIGLKHIETPFVLILDSDCHLLSIDWKEQFQKKIEEFDCITVQGPVIKPIRAACLCLRTELAQSLDWRATEEYQGHRITPDGLDVGIKAYYEMIKQGKKFHFMKVFPNRYETFNGEEYGFDKPLVYHHWHSSYTGLIAHEYPGIDLITDKKKLKVHFKNKLFL